MRFQKEGENVPWASTGHETLFSSKFGAKLRAETLDEGPRSGNQ